MANETSMPWVKIYSEILDDPKLGRLPELTRWRFVQLIVMAGECDAEGLLVSGDHAMSEKDIAWRLRVRAELLHRDLTKLQSIGVLVNTDDGWRVSKFGERQGRKQSEKREMWRVRQHRRRDINSDIDVTHAGVTRDKLVTHAPREEEEKRREEERNKGAEQTAPEAAPPTTESNQPEPQSPLSVGQRQFLEALGAKRFKTNVQREAVLALEKTYGTSKLQECVLWASKRGMGVGQAIGAIETAIKTWGSAKPPANGHKPTDPVFNPVLTPEQERLKASMAAHKAKQHANPS